MWWDEPNVKLSLDQAGFHLALNMFCVVITAAVFTGSLVAPGVFCWSMVA